MAEAAIGSLADASRAFPHVCIVGAPIRRNQRLYNCAVAIAHGRILGIVPKSFLPNYREFYENRWFAPGAGVRGLEAKLAGQTVPFGVDLMFGRAEVSGYTFHIELCEDFWVATPPSSLAALAGATILCNLSASNVVIGKAQDRAMLCAAQSLRCLAAYAYTAAGPGESTTDLAWDGQATIHQLGTLLAETARFPLHSQWAFADVDLERIQEARDSSALWKAARDAAGIPAEGFRRV